MKINFKYFVLLFLFACTHTQKSPYRVASNTRIPNNKILLKFEVLKLSIKKGEVKKVYYPLLNFNIYDFDNISIKCNDINQGFDIKDGHLRTFISFDYNLEKSKFDCELLTRIDDKHSRYKILEVTELPFDYPTKKINVPKKHVDLKPKDLKRWLKEQKILKEVYSNSVLNRSLFDSDFRRPLYSKVTAVYGSKRVFNNKKKSWHSGVDLRARRPTPIPSSNTGKVVLVMDLFFNGKTVLVDHGLGIFSMYCHMSSFKVNKGDMVRKGDILGLTGNTGRSNAPHLHWGMRVNGNWVNGLEFVKESI